MVVLEVGPLVGVADDDAVAERAGLLLDEAGQLGEVRIEYVTDDQAEGAGLRGAQRAGHGVGPVAEGVDGGEDAGARLFADGRMAVQHPRDRGDGDSRLGRDIFDARHVRTTSLWFPYTSKPGADRSHDAVESITETIGIDYMAENKTLLRVRDRIVIGRRAEESGGGLKLPGPVTRSGSAARPR
ncbi:protein of unknown function [Streptomyces sp. KY75]|nr:protein of unknown function [Streptomyces sp. KY70]CAD5990655.1 protein of unknown function [Streptomyces sp. KY75]